MKIEMFLVRHGETIANKDNILQGHTDFPLTDRGQEESMKVGEVFAAYDWSRVYTSDLNRSIKTTIIIFSKRSEDIPITTESLLREISFGVLEGLPRNTSVEEAKKIVAKRQNISIEEVDDNSETREEVILRQKTFIDNMYNELLSESLKNNYPDQVHKVLVVSHGGYIKLLLKALCHYTNVSAICNGSITRVVVEKNQHNNDYIYRVNENEINCYEHLVGVNKDLSKVYNWSRI